MSYTELVAVLPLQEAREVLFGGAGWVPDIPALQAWLGGWVSWGGWLVIQWYSGTSLPELHAMLRFIAILLGAWCWQAPGRTDHSASLAHPKLLTLR